MSPIRKSEIRKKSRIFRKVYVSGTHTSAVQRAQEKLGVFFLFLFRKLVGKFDRRGWPGWAGWASQTAQARPRVARQVCSPTSESSVGHFFTVGHGLARGVGQSTKK